MVAERESVQTGARAVIRTPDQRLRVFVSSTLQELAAERSAARDAIAQLRLVPVLFELGARPHPPRDLYRAYLEQSHIFLGIYWQRYGWVAPDMDISGLEDEYVLAVDHPKLVYIKQPASDRDAGLDQLLDRIRDDGTTSYRPFSTAAELRDLVENDLAVMLTERFETTSRANAPTVTQVPSDTLPLAPSPLVGRELEVRALTDLLCGTDVRMVTMTGPGGSGKTRLSVELAEIMRDRFGLRVCFVDLTGQRSAELVLPTIANALGVRDAGDRSLIDAIGVVLGDSSRLLIVDNFEHVMPAATALADILAVTSNVKILVTSRQPLHLRWEQEYPLFPLEVPDAREHLGVAAVATASAVELLVQRARRVRPDFELTADNADAIAEIARKLDGLPLALELAAARLRILAPADLLRRLEHRLDTLAGASRDAPSRHRTLREAISWSHDLLTEDEQALFRRLGVFAGGASLEAVESVCCGDGVESQLVLDLLASLVDKSLVVSRTDATSGHMRFHLLETIREYAMEELVVAGEAEVVFDAHLTWCTDLAEGLWDVLWGPEMPAALDLLEREHDNLRTALDHAAGAGDALMGLRTAHCLWPFWDVRGHYREGQRRLQVLLNRGPQERSVPRGRALDALGWLTALLGDFEAAYVVMHEGLAMVREAGDKRDLMASLGELGNVTFSLGYAGETEALANEALSLATELDEPFMIGWNHFLLGYVAFLRGDLVAMKDELDEALSLIGSIFQPWGVAWAQFSLGIINIMNGDLETANREITGSLEMRWSIRDLRGTTDCLGILAYLASARGEMDQRKMEWSARLHGANELQLTANGLTMLPFLQPMHEESVARLRESLGREALDELWQAGRTTTLEKIVSEALHGENR